MDISLPHLSPPSKVGLLLELPLRDSEYPTLNGKEKKIAVFFNVGVASFVAFLHN